jgi:hypothetical protein
VKKTKQTRTRKTKLSIASEQIRVLHQIEHVVGGFSTDPCSEAVQVTCPTKPA